MKLFSRRCCVLSLWLLGLSLAGCGGTDSLDPVSSSSSSSGSSSSSSTSGSAAGGSSSSGSGVVIAQLPGSATEGREQFAGQCNNCHRDQFDGTFSRGLHAFSVDQFTYPGFSQYSNYSDASAVELARFIADNMAGPGCGDVCANNIASYLWAYRTRQKTVDVQAVQLDDLGLRLELSCAETASLRVDVFAGANATVDAGSLLHSQALACLPVAQTLSLAGLADQQLLQVQFFQGDAWLETLEVVRSGAAGASCAARGELLNPKLRRLSQVQMRNALGDVFGDLFGEVQWPDLEDGAMLIGMNTMADKLAINNLNLERIYDSSRSLVATLLGSHPEIAGCAAAATNTCVQPLLEAYGKRLWRRPLTDSEQADLLQAAAAFANNRDALELVFNALLLSSEFLFRSEIGVLEQGERQLDNYEIASLLAFSIWNSGPDDTLLDLAAQAQPLQASQLQQQVTRMITDPRTSDALTEIYKDYLKLDLVLSRDKAEYLNFDAGVRRELLVSAEQMLAAKLAPAEHFMAPFGESLWFVNDTVAPFFGVSTAASTLTASAISPSERYGVLNHPAFLAVHSTLAESGIVKRGVFALEQLLCEELPDPPGDVMALPTPAEVDPATTSERTLLQLTHSSQPGCQACHQFIDPAGFGFENFDAVGRYRTLEKSAVVIDASGTLQVGSEVLSYATSADYARALTGSDAMTQCVQKRFLEHFLSQELAASQCELNRYRALLSPEPTVAQLLMALVQLDSFSRRTAE